MGPGPQDEINDAMLIAAIRRRLLAEISEGSDASSIVNNVYGSSPIGNNGITEGLSAGGGQAGGAPGGQDPFDYFVDINRRDEFDAEGEKIGWNKNVHRYRKKKAQGQLT